VMSFASETRFSATDDPTCPAPSITIFKTSALYAGKRRILVLADARGQQT
jgi:hypothetical protein